MLENEAEAITASLPGCDGQQGERAMLAWVFIQAETDLRMCRGLDFMEAWNWVSQRQENFDRYAHLLGFDPETMAEKFTSRYADKAKEVAEELRAAGRARIAEEKASAERRKKNKRDWFKRNQERLRAAKAAERAREEREREREAGAQKVARNAMPWVKYHHRHSTLSGLVARL